MEIIGGEGTFEDQEDGAAALVVPEGAYVKLQLPGMSPWQLEEDGRLHRYSLLMAVRLDRLPAAAMALFNGGVPLSQGENVDSCLLYKNGGVGLLGQMGDANAAVRPGRWAWLVVTRSGDNEVTTYVNGRLCAKINASVAQPKEGKGSAGPGRGGDGGGDASRAVDEGGGKTGEEEGTAADGNGNGKCSKGGKSGKPEQLPQRLRVDPQHLALFPPPASADGADEGERGLSLRYLKLTSECWDAEEVRKQLDALRSQDEEAELEEEAERARLAQLTLQPLYARPPPVWLHPAFAAEFGDAFIAGTGLEGGSLHVSLEVVVLVLEQMLRAGGVAEHLLPHADRASLNSVLAALGEGKKLAHKLAHASAADGQQRLYLSKVMGDLASLEPGGMLPIPCSIGGSPSFLLVRRGAGAEADVCTVAVVGCEAEALTYGHRCAAAPPKILYETCLELRNVKLSKLLDESLWVLVWYAGAPNDGKLPARKVFYQVVLSFLAEGSLDQAILASDDLRKEAEEDGEREGAGGGEGSSAVGRFRTPRRSKSAHYGSVRHALAYMLKSQGVGQASRKLISLLLRTQMLAMAAHDLGFVRHVSGAERAVLGLACRQLAYKAAKLGKPPAPSSSSSSSPLPSSPVLEMEHLRNVRRSIAALRAKLQAVPGAEADAEAPPPLILCEASAHLGRPSPAVLLGVGGLSGGARAEDGAELLPPVGASDPNLASSTAGSDGAAGMVIDVTDGGDDATPAEVAANPTEEHVGLGRSPSLAAIEDADVVGLYFSAGWCPACKTVTPLIASAYQSIRGRGGKLAVVLVSLDKSEAEFEQTRAAMPWPSLPFGAGTRAAMLATAFHVDAIPTFVLLRADGSVLSNDGIRLMRKHTRSFPWLTKLPPPPTPHLHPLFERLLRPHPVDTGLASELPGYTPIDFLQLPVHVRSLDDAIEAVRHTDRLATLIAVQSHCVKNTQHLIFALIQHTFTQLLPMPQPQPRKASAATEDGAATLDVHAADEPLPTKGEASGATCIWCEPMEYADQLDLLILLQRLIEHFAAAAFSLDHTRAADAVRMVVPACIAAVADCVLRQVASDIPSEASTHLVKYALSAGHLAKQSAGIAAHHAELNTARAACLDYFDSLAHLPRLFEWHRSERLDTATASYLSSLCKDVAFPTDDAHLHEYVIDPHALVLKNYPELRCYRDIAFYAKLFLNPDIRRFPPKTGWKQRHAELTFGLEPPSNSRPYFTFVVKAFSDMQLLCRPKVKKGEMPPSRRFSQLSAPSEYTRPHDIETEDDVLHLWELPDFVATRENEGASSGSDAAGGGGGGARGGHAAGALGQHDSELLLSYLTVPYLRIPLVVSFFATDDRIHSLQSPTLQALLDAALFEPGHHLPLDAAGLEPVDVPTSAPTLLGTPHHLLMNELVRSPSTLVGSVLALARQACNLDTGTLFSSTATVILYAVRLCSRIDNFLSMLLAYDGGTHESIVGQPFRGLELGPGVRPTLESARAELRSVLWADLRGVLLGWYQKLVLECETSSSDLVLDINTRHMCNLHAHLLLMLRNASPADLSEPFASTITCGMVFLSTRHEWNHELLDRKPGRADQPWDGWRIPETELFECLHVLRRKLVLWMRHTACAKEVDAVMDRVLRVSASTGSMQPSARGNEERGRWAYVAGDRSRGRFARHSIRTAGASGELSESSDGHYVVSSGAEEGMGREGGPIGLMEDDGQLAVEVDAQVMQLTLKASHPQALPDEVAQLKDVHHVFGEVSMQACLTEQSKLRSCYKVVGRNHDIEFWPRPDETLPQLDHHRPYYPEELYPSEKVRSSYATQLSSALRGCPGSILVCRPIRVSITPPTDSLSLPTPSLVSISTGLAAIGARACQVGVPDLPSAPADLPPRGPAARGCAGRLPRRQAA